MKARLNTQIHLKVFWVDPQWFGFVQKGPGSKRKKTIFFNLDPLSIFDKRSRGLSIIHRHNKWKHSHPSNTQQFSKMSFFPHSSNISWLHTHILEVLCYAHRTRSLPPRRSVICKKHLSISLVSSHVALGKDTAKGLQVNLRNGVRGTVLQSR